MKKLMTAALVALLMAGCNDGTSTPEDAGTDSGTDAGTDAGVDGGVDAGTDAGGDAGGDEGPVGLPVDIVRDALGVAHVFAEDLRAAFYGLGHAAAEDRLFQMDFNRRYTAGRLSEFYHRAVDAPAECVADPCDPAYAGNPRCVAACDRVVYNDKVLAHDERMRILGLSAHNTEVVGVLPPESRELLEAYAAGVNAYITREGFSLPAAYAVLGITDVEAWAPADCLDAWDRVAHDFSGNNMQTEINNLVDCQDGCDPPPCDRPIDEDAAVVPAGDAADWPPSYPPPPSPRDAHQEVVRKFSHGWVVHGSRTTTGKPVLGADPKISVWAPSLFYPFHISAGDMEVRGIGFAGSPAMIIFWNRNVAQTVTAAGSDIADLFEITEGAPGTYVVDGVEEAFGERTEIIRLRHSAPEVQVLVRTTRYGPIVNPLLNNVPAGRLFALQHLETARPDTHSVVASLAAMRATSLHTYRVAIDQWVAPAAHGLYAGVDANDPGGAGHIAYHPLGGIPRRVAKLVDGEDLRGRYPYDGSLSAEDWQGMLDIDERPHVIDPDTGYLFSGNHLAVGSWYDDYAYSGLGGNGDSFRSLILRYLLRDALAGPDDQMSPEEIHAIHFDAALPIFDIYRDALRYLADRNTLGTPVGADEAATTANEKALKVLDALDAWDAEGGLYGHSSAYARLGSFLLGGNTGLVLQSRYGNHPEISCAWNEAQGGVCFLFKALDQDIAGTMDPDIVGLLVDVAALAWDKAAGEGFDPNPANWSAPDPMPTYTVLYQANFFCSNPGPNTPENCQLDPGPAFDVTLDRAFSNTINSAVSSSMPATVDFADVEASLAYFPPGVSEDPASPRFDNVVPVWEAVARGEPDSFPQAPLDRAAVEAGAVSVETLHFLP